MINFNKVNEFLNDNFLFFTYCEMLSIVNLCYECKIITEDEKELLIEKVNNYYL